MTRISLEFDTEQSFQKVQATLYEPKTIVSTLIFVHDLYEHRMRYEPLADFFNSLGVAVLTYDLRGYRNSLIGNQEGYLGFREDLYRDLKRMVQYMKARYEGVDTVVMGVGFGALLALNQFKAAPQECDRLILVSPVVKPKFYYLRSLVFKVLGWRAPKSYSTGIWPTHFPYKKRSQSFSKWDYLSSDKQVIASYHLDPLCGRSLANASLSEVLAVIKQGQKAMEMVVPIDKRVLLIGGKEDPLTHYGHGVINLKQQLTSWGIQVDDVLLFMNQGHDVLSSLAGNNVLKTGLQGFILS